MSGPAGPDPATPGPPREAVEGTRCLPGKELPGEDKKQKASTKRKRGGEEDACSRLRPSKIQCTPPPRIQPGRTPLSGHQAMGEGGGGGGGGAYKLNGKINNYY